MLKRDQKYVGVIRNLEDENKKLSQMVKYSVGSKHILGNKARNDEKRVEWEIVRVLKSTDGNIEELDIVRKAKGIESLYSSKTEQRINFEDFEASHIRIIETG